ncbi:sulfatase-like hydrolase/transferase [Paenibacillus oryzisoli]|uniref:Sulfatase N-terminal domain-containing protein n=1 Tax=Paenibacillus oryzisoli TaxID=1850517 RepID=A0A198AFZ5_9BACL|nr:sulfatase-like hydrolase/transferase [Paenibacillus oryzisoli]OAS20444.1 hypothetical protein A8708_17855 [Paenibacillus oryzisoli]
MKSRPNILLITTDQQRADCLGIAQSTHPVMTPHLDQLANEGIQFSRTYVDCPLCVPSRTTIMTGRSAYNHGVVSNGHYRIPEVAEDTLPGRLLSAGYQTHAAGKMQFTPPRNRNGFERMRLVPEDYVNFLETTEYRGTYRGHGVGGNEVYPVFSAAPIRYTSTHWTVEESIDFLRQRDQDTPFFMWTSFEAPHPPLDPPESFVRLYDGIPISDPVQSDWSGGESSPEWVRARKRSHKLDMLPPHIISMARKHYYAQITHIDYELGRLFGELQGQKLWDNTLVIFTSDHGEMLGDHGLFHKTCFYEPSTRVPFLLKPPKGYGGQLSPSEVVDTPITLADLYPTVLAYAGCLKDEDRNRDGRSLLDMESIRKEREWVFGYMNDRDGLYMVANKDWKYLYYVCGGQEQLFYLKEDPFEQQELSNSSAEHCRAQLLEMREALAVRFPELREDGMAGASQLKQTEPRYKESELTASNPFAWRGPIRYGGGW